MPAGCAHFCRHHARTKSQKWSNQDPNTPRATRDDSPITKMDAPLITLLKDYWLPIVVAFAALGLWIHHKITALLDDDEE